MSESESESESQSVGEFLLPDYMKDRKSVSSAKLSRHLSTAGFGRLTTSGDNSSWIRVHEGRLSTVTERDVRRYLCDDAEASECDDAIVDVVLNTRAVVPALTRLPLLSLDPQSRVGTSIPLLVDDSQTVRFPFDNGVVTITADAIRCMPYGADSWVTPVERVIPHEVELDAAKAHGRFENFCERAFYRPTGVGGPDWTADFAMTDDAAEHYRAFQGTLGYLLHGYRDPANPRAVLYVDMDSDQALADGGNGKSLTLRALRHLRQTVFQDGKRYGASREGARFQFSNVTETTQLVVIDDVTKAFHFETLFALLTGDMELERKGRDKTVLPAHRVPKVALTSNYVLPPNGTSFERRVYLVEFGSYWTTANRHGERISDPKHLGCRLFEAGFTAQDWQDAFGYLFRCVQLYLRDGVTPASLGLYRVKALRREMGTEFLDWATEFFETYDVRRVDPQVGDYLTDLCQAMKVQSKDTRCAPTEFAGWLKRVGDVCGYEYNPHKADKGSTPTARRWRITSVFGRIDDAVWFVKRSEVQRGR